MLTKNGGNAWNSKKKFAGDDHRHPLRSWPQSQKQEDLTKGDEVESWPKLGGSRLKKKYVGNGELESLPRVGYGGCYSATASPKPSAISTEMKELICKANEFKDSPNKGEPIVTVRTSDSIHTFQKPSFEESEKGTLSNKEEKSLSFKKLNKERKEEKKAERRKKKEEDTLRSMLGPKGLKVTVIDNNTFSKFSGQGEVKNRSQQTFLNFNEVQLDSSAFPELRNSTGKLGAKRSISRSTTTPNSIPVGDNEVTKFNTEENSERTLDSIPPKSAKPKKRRDPVVVDIWKAIEICRAGKKMEEETDGEDITRVSRPKGKDSSRIAGNILDASNPSRHRGKKREVPKKRNESRLKKAIMAERIRRREARICGSKCDTVGNIIVHEVKILNFSNETSTLVLGVNDLHGHAGVVQGPKLSGNTDEAMGVERGERIEECHLKPCSDASTAVDRMAKDTFHSRSFREYCNHSKSSNLSENVRLMLKDILKFQDRLHATQPIKAESHRRYVVGLRQTQHLLAVNKVKIVILAQDIEKVPSPGGLDDVVNAIINSANKQNIPVVFPLTRRQLGKVTYRKVGVSCVGVLNYQGSEENFKKIVSDLEDSKKDYEEKFGKEKMRVMSELGILPMKKEDCKDEMTEEKVNSTPVECPVTLPLLQKLTEALSDLSIGSASQTGEKEELCDL